MKTLDGATVDFNIVGSGVYECKRRGADIRISLVCRKEVLEDVFLSDVEATALANKLLHVVAENKKG